MQWSVVWPGVCRTFSSGTPSVKNVCPCCNWSSFNPLKYSGYESSFFSSLLRGCFHILQGSPPWTEMSKQKNYRISDWHRLKIVFLYEIAPSLFFRHSKTSFTPPIWSWWKCVKIMSLIPAFSSFNTCFKLEMYSGFLDSPVSHSMRLKWNEIELNSKG